MIVLLVLLFQLIFIYFLPLNITSGDGAELVTSIALNGIAHPSGYPVYTILAKLLTFLPLGTIAFRISFFSSVFASLSIYFFCKIVQKITKSDLASIFAGISIFLSYSFFNQSLVQKFYTLNMLIVSILIYLGITVILDGYKRKIQFLYFFILGLAFSCHHTALFMIFPAFYLAVIFRREFFKNFVLSFLYFLTGIVINFYIFIKLSKQAFTFFPMKVNLWECINYYIFRGVYSGSSISVMKNTYSFLDGYLYTIVNNIKVIQTNFPLYFTYLFFILGVFFLFKINKKLFIFFILSFFSYSILIGKLTLSAIHPTIVDYYIAANQYFLPMFGIFAVLSAFGFFYLSSLIKRKYKYVYYLFTILPFFYFIIFPIRFHDNLWSNNIAIYQSRIDHLFTKPVNGYYITMGDNPIFQTAYLKKIANFRNDICQISRKSLNANYLINCFNKKGTLFDAYENINFNKFLNKYYSYSFPIFFATTDVTNQFNRYIDIKFLSDYLLIAKNKDKKDSFYFEEYDNSKDIFNVFTKKNSDFKFKVSENFGKSIESMKNKFKKIYNYLPCLEHCTDDYFTYGSCYSTYINNQAISQDIKFKLIKYNSSLMPYILTDSNLSKNFTMEDYVK